MHHTIHAGSTEYIMVTVGDRLEAVEDITALLPAFTIYAADDTVQQASTLAEINDDEPMVALCLINTGTPTLWSSGIYRLILSLTAAPEAPLLKAATFKVEQI